MLCEKCVGVCDACECAEMGTVYTGEPGGEFVLPLLLLLQTMPCLARLIFVLRREAPTKYKEVGNPLCQTIREQQI